MPASQTDFDEAYRSVPRRRMSPAASARIAVALREAEAARLPRAGAGPHVRPAAGPHAGRGVSRWQLVAACVLVAVASHVVTRWTVVHRPVVPTSFAALEPVSVSMDAVVFPSRYQTHIRAWQPGMPAPENSP